MKFSPSTLKQREEFYRNEFNIKKVESWFKKNDLPFPQIMAVDMGTETGIIKKKEKKGSMINMKAEHLKEKLLNYLPEDVYYDRNIYMNTDKVLRELNFRTVWRSKNFLGQELAFDIDPENIKCGCRKRFPDFCEECMLITVEKSIGLAEWLHERFEKIGFVYSGRGMHVHVFDKDAYNLSIKERNKLSVQAKRFNVDPWVSRGHIRLIRLPYSLNSLVSRLVVPLTWQEAKKFNPITSKKTIPRFLKKR